MFCFMLMSDLIRYLIYLAVHSFNNITIKILFLLFENLILEAAPSENVQLEIRNDRQNAKQYKTEQASVIILI